MKDTITTKSITKRLSIIFPKVKIVKNSFCIKIGSNNFLEGLCIERTPYKNTFYVWSVACPLWSASNKIYLDYSERIKEASYFTGELDSIISDITDSLPQKDNFSKRMQGSETTLQSFRTANFDNFNWMESQFTYRIMDFGIVLALMGELDTSHACLSDYLKKSVYDSEEQRQFAEKIIDSISNNDNEHLSLINNMNQRNLTNLLNKTPL